MSICRLVSPAFVLCATFITISANVVADDTRPNVLLIVVDDMGYSDIGPFGGEISTPTLNALAESGMTFSDFHTSPTCSPTRSMLLSGTDHHLAGLGTMSEALAPNQKGRPGYEGYLNRRVVSIASVLQDAGYHTCMSGKWHLGEKEEHDPSRRGFRKAYAFLQGGASHFDDEWMMYANYTPVYRENGIRVHVPQAFYSTEFYTSKLIEYLGARANDQPFFAYLSFTAPHDPLHAPDEWINKYKGKYDVGYDVLRERRLQRLKQLGLVNRNVKPFPRLPTIPAWSELTEQQRKTEARKMEVYAAMISNIDHHLGRLFRHLKEAGEWENTLVVFFSDNGANGSEMHQYPQTDKDWVERNSDNRFENLGRKFSRIATGPAWAQVSMTPFRMYKAFPAEGGIRSPLIIRGPNVANQGERNDAFAHVTDIAVTILDITKTPVPGPVHQGRRIHPPRGRSLVPVLSGQSQVTYEDDTAVSWELFGMRAVRKGDLKLLWLPKPFGNDDWQLYDLASDPGELNDLSERRPATRDEMIQAWNRYASETGVILPSHSVLSR